MRLFCTSTITGMITLTITTTMIITTIIITMTLITPTLITLTPSISVRERRGLMRQG